MTATDRSPAPPRPGGEQHSSAGHPFRRDAFQAPFIRAPEGARTIFLVTLIAACAPLAAGMLFFGWRAAGAAMLCVVTCAAIEAAYYRVTHAPSLHGRTHAYLTGVLLALTLPPAVPWYVPVVASAFAILVGKAAFGGVGHFLWQPALVGRLAVAVMFPSLLNPGEQGVLAQNRLLIGDVAPANLRTVEDYRGWRGQPAPQGADGFKLPLPTEALSKLTRPVMSSGVSRRASYSGLAQVPVGIPRARPAALRAPPPDRLPPISDLLIGARPGGIGETSAIVLVVAGLYLVYRNYIRWVLPVAFVLSAWAMAAIAPVCLAGPNDVPQTFWWPLVLDGLDVGFTYVNYQVLSGELLLAAVFLATEMTSRPVSVGGQALFGLGAGALTMFLQLYVDVPVPAYWSVLAMNTSTPLIDAAWRPRVFGRRLLASLAGRRETGK